MENWHSIKKEDVFRQFNSHIDGLEKSDAKERLEKYGLNQIEQKDSNHPVLLFLAQFRSGLIYVLIAAAFIAGVFGKWIDVYVISGIILINAILGFFQEYKAEKAINALRSMVVPTAKVYRDGELLKISSEKIVPGDVVLLEEGDKIPADVRLFNVKDFRTNESSLTGESLPAAKRDDVFGEETEVADRKNMAWMGTFVSGGKARGIVVSTGEETIFGQIAKDMGEIEKGGGHFEEKVSILTKRMAIFAFCGASFIFIISSLREGASIAKGIDSFQESLFASIAALVSGIPEGLPAILVIILAAGATRMARRRAIIRNLPVTETLGVADHIISDKTGTITQNTMTVRKIVLPGKDVIEVTGKGYEPKGNFYRDNSQIIPLEENVLDKLLHIAEVCSEAELTHEENGNDKYEIIGDPTEAALVVLAEKAGLRQEIIQRNERKLDDMPFNSKDKLRASLIEKDGEREIYVVGAPEALIKRATKIREKDGERKMEDKDRKELIANVNEMSEDAMRTIALAYKKADTDIERVEKKDLGNLVLTGVVGIIDPPREGVKEAVEKANRAGIRVVMCTGDHKKTAAAISKEVGILKEKKEGFPEALEHSQLKKMSDSEFRRSVLNVNVFARLTPHMKLKIAKTLQMEGAIIAMTGDGVNDAPAVKQADIGIAMGVMGSDVTKEAGDIVLADDNFASIVSAIEEGRVVFENTRKASSSLITSNFAEIGTIVTFLLIGLPLPLLPTQILWVNLVTDGVVGVPLALEPKHEDILKKPPRDKKETILVAQIIPYFVLMTVLMVTMTLFVFNMFYAGGEGLEKARTAAFTVIAFTQLYNAINLRSLDRSVFSIGFFSNKYMIIGLLVGVFLQFAVIFTPALRELFHFEALSLYEIMFVALLTSFVLWIGEFYKSMRIWIYKNKLFG